MVNNCWTCLQENVLLSATGTDVAGPSLVCPNCSDINGKASPVNLRFWCTGLPPDDLSPLRKHDDDRRFVCTEEGCGKSFTRAEHLKGHSITHLGTKPFQCHAEGIYSSGMGGREDVVQLLMRFLCCSGCNARFSARSSLYIHSKKHRQDGSSLKTLCPVANCSKNFSSRSSLKSHILKQHHVSPGMAGGSHPNRGGVSCCMYGHRFVSRLDIITVSAWLSFLQTRCARPDGHRPHPDSQQ